MVLASKKSSRLASEGLLALAQNESKAALIELNCETDFVARNEIFQFLVSGCCRSNFFFLYPLMLFRLIYSSIFFCSVNYDFLFWSSYVFLFSFFF